MQAQLDKFWHKTLRQPYELAKTVDQGTGQTVILLHGIGRSGLVWQHVVEQFKGLGYRVVALDLLGFGASPKPVWPNYSVDDHALAVINTIKKLGARQPVIIIGHSMGCLVAVRVARLRPDLVKHMVLYEMPLYEGLPKKRLYQIRLNIYYRLYDKIAQYQPTFDKETAKLAEKMASKIAGFEVRKSSWLPFVRSLQNTIMKQTTAGDLKILAMPIDVIYGLFDMLVIRGKPRETFGTQKSLITSHTVSARHTISPRASRFIVQRVEAAEHPEKASIKKRNLLSHAKQLRKSTKRPS
jgi:pimeloyl-ACP methyl ester carboxylesterase